jgi:hypothetical protein
VADRTTPLREAGVRVLFAGRSGGVPNRCAIIKVRKAMLNEL